MTEVKIDYMCLKMKAPPSVSGAFFEVLAKCAGALTQIRCFDNWDKDSYYLQELKFEFKSIKLHIKEPKLLPSFSSDGHSTY